ncbi:MAG: exopolyphosphatase [Burkholderiales bacterium]|jgi:exopolyphosphatase/guanosine-5'-triphosphate,3'-diphosphate pyrophosphatase|nr:exopolyphosphatase [Burkholderiales bacterium]
MTAARTRPARARGVPEPDVVAAVDLGSNSFRLQVCRVEDDHLYPLDSLREPVRLAAGLGPDKRIDAAAQDRALVALHRFGERLRGLSPDAVRAVGTNTLRVAKNAPEFLARAERALGFPIDVVAGKEEARLIYLGVSHGLPPTDDRRLVIDIGGGSTEFIIGAGLRPQKLESLYMGCVSYTLRFFPDGRITKPALRAAETAARIEVQTIERDFASGHWAEAVGSSGTARALGDLIQASGWGDGHITADGLERLRDKLLKAGHTDRIALPGLRSDRAQVLPGGFAIMAAAFGELGIERMTLANGAMRQGILYDMLGRFHQQDMREVTVRQFAKRYHVDAAQARRVEALALGIQAGLATGAAPDPAARQMLAWAARLHEIGLTVAHAGYHKHTAYILANADMPGFSRMEQARLARLALAHRGTLEKSRTPVAATDDWSPILALRLACLFHRSRTVIALPSIGATRRERRFALTVPPGWLARYPLTAAALRAEVREWAAVGFELDIDGLAAADALTESAPET